MTLSVDQDEEARLAVLRSYGVLDSEAEAEFDDLVSLAALLCDVPMARVSLVDRDRQWMLARSGPGDQESTLDKSICRHALGVPDLLLIPDALLDDRVSANPVVTGGPRYRFYAGAPLRGPDGHTLGALCVLDTQPRVLSELQLDQLRLLARQVMAQLTRRRLIHQLTMEVAARRVAEAGLVEKTRMLDGLFANTDALIYAKDLDGRFILGNDALTQVLNQSAEVHAPETMAEVFGRSDEDYFPTSAEEFQRNDLQVSVSGRPHSFRERILLPGGVRHYLSHKFPLRDQQDQIYGVAGVSTDITELIDERRQHAEAEQRWRQLFDASPVGIAVADENGLWTQVNEAFCTLFGRPATELIGNDARGVMHPEDVSKLPGTGERIERAKDGVLTTEWRVLRPSGEVRWMWATLRHIPGPQGQQLTLAHCLDVTEQVIAERAKRDRDADLSAVARVTRQIQSGADARQLIVDAVAELAQTSVVCLFEPRRVPATSSDLDAPDHAGPSADRRAGGPATNARTVLVTTATTSPELRNLTIHLDEKSLNTQVSKTRRELFIPDLSAANGASPRLAGLRPTRSMYLVPIIATDDGPVGVLTAAWEESVADLDDRRAEVVRLLADQAAVALRQAALMDELESLALTDDLTGLPNRRGWDQDLRTMMDRARLRDLPLVVAVIDLDLFKKFNDSFGHAAGDVHLRRFAAGALGALRLGDTIARWGGEEFAVALPDCAFANGEAVLDRVRASVPNGQTCSVGYATWDGSESAEDLLARADRALYTAKASGRDQCVGDATP